MVMMTVVIQIIMMIEVKMMVVMMTLVLMVTIMVLIKVMMTIKVMRVVMMMIAINHIQTFKQGYVDKARKREDMFSEEYISTIFGNIEQLYLFSNNFYNVLEDSVRKDSVHLSCIGKRFVERVKDF